MSSVSTLMPPEEDMESTLEGPEDFEGLYFTPSKGDELKKLSEEELEDDMERTLPLSGYYIPAHNSESIIVPPTPFPVCKAASQKVQPTLPKAPQKKDKSYETGGAEFSLRIPESSHIGEIQSSDPSPTSLPALPAVTSQGAEPKRKLRSSQKVKDCETEVDDSYLGSSESSETSAMSSSSVSTAALPPTEQPTAKPRKNQSKKDTKAKVGQKKSKACATQVEEPSQSSESSAPQGPTEATKKPSKPRTTQKKEKSYVININLKLTESGLVPAPSQDKQLIPSPKASTSSSSNEIAIQTSPAALLAKIKDEPRSTSPKPRRPRKYKTSAEKFIEESLLWMREEMERDSSTDDSCFSD